MVGIVIHLKDKYVFKQNNKISKKPIYPMFLNNLKIVNYEYIGVL